MCNGDDTHPEMTILGFGSFMVVCEKCDFFDHGPNIGAIRTEIIFYEMLDIFVLIHSSTRKLLFSFRAKNGCDHLCKEHLMEERK